MISTGMYLTKLLETYGVNTVFGIPGVHTVELYRGLAGSTIRHMACSLLMPRAPAASIWPPSTEMMPARTISDM